MALSVSCGKAVSISSRSAERKMPNDVQARYAGEEQRHDRVEYVVARHADEHERDDDRQRLDDVRQQMARVRCDRDGSANPGRAHRISTDREVHCHGNAHDGERWTDIDLRGAVDQAQDRRDGDEHGPARDQRGLRHRRQALGFAVAVGVRLVRRLLRKAHRKERQARGEEVLCAVDAVAEHGDRSENQADGDLEHHQRRVRRDGQDGGTAGDVSVVERATSRGDERHSAYGTSAREAKARDVGPAALYGVSPTA